MVEDEDDPDELGELFQAREDYEQVARIRRLTSVLVAVSAPFAFRHTGFSIFVALLLTLAATWLEEWRLMRRFQRRQAAR